MMRRYVKLTWKQKSEVNVKNSTTSVEAMLVMRGQKDKHAKRNWAVFTAVFSLVVATAVCTRGWLEASLDIFLLAPVLGVIAEMHDAHVKGRGGYVMWLSTASPILGPGCAIAFVACLLRLTREISTAGFVIASCMGLVSLRAFIIFARAMRASRIDKASDLARRRA